MRIGVPWTASREDRSELTASFREESNKACIFADTLSVSVVHNEDSTGTSTRINGRVETKSTGFSLASMILGVQIVMKLLRPRRIHLTIDPQSRKSSHGVRISTSLLPKHAI